MVFEQPNNQATVTLPRSSESLDYQSINQSIAHLQFNQNNHPSKDILNPAHAKNLTPETN